MKKYLVILQDGSKHLVSATATPTRHDYAKVIEAPSDAQYGEDLDIEEVTTEEGTIETKVIVNQDRISARLAQQSEREAQAELAKQQRLDKLKALRDKPNRGLKEINEIIDILLERIAHETITD